MDINERPKTKSCQELGAIHDLASPNIGAKAASYKTLTQNTGITIALICIKEAPFMDSENTLVKNSAIGTLSEVVNSLVYLVDTMPSLERSVVQQTSTSFHKSVWI